MFDRAQGIPDAAVCTPCILRAKEPKDIFKCPYMFGRYYDCSGYSMELEFRENPRKKLSVCHHDVKVDATGKTSCSFQKFTEILKEMDAVARTCATCSRRGCRDHFDGEVSPLTLAEVKRLAEDYDTVGSLTEVLTNLVDMEKPVTIGSCTSFIIPPEYVDFGDDFDDDPDLQLALALACDDDIGA